MTFDDDDFVRHLRDKLEATPEPPVPPEAMSRWRKALDVAARAQTRRPVATGWRFAAVTAVVLLSVGASFLAYREQTAAPVEGPVAGARAERIVQLHLLDLEAHLARVSDLPLAERTTTIRELAHQNRLQTAVAERAGGGREARVLRAFTVALDDMAADLQANGNLKAALAQLDFELKVTQARLASSSPSTGVRRSQAL